MGFPFIAPLKPEIVKKLKDRESNNQFLNHLSPFIMLSSAAVVTNSGKDVKSIIKDKDYTNAYKGCVVANTTDIKNIYQTSETIAGYDLDGVPIKVIGETNRRVSTPIITQMELDTDGNNNTLKTARVDIKVFTLKQLEMFELFFLRPGMKVVLEWGWNSDIRDSSQKYVINSKLFAKKGFEKYVTDFTNIFSHRDNAYKDAKEAYLETLKITNYDYDFMAGNVSNFSFTPDADGTYNINLEISAGNELQLWMPLKQSQPSGKGNKASNDKGVKEFQSWVNKLAADLNVIELANIIKEKDDKNEFFNWGVINAKQDDSKYSKDPYVSFRLILKILNNIVVLKQSNEHLRTMFEYDSKAIIPINSAPAIISTTTDFILPGELPSIKVVTDNKKKEKIVIKKGEYISCKINGYSFNITNHTKPTPKKLKNKTNPTEEHAITSFTGNLLNVFFRWTTFVNIYNKAYTQADVVNSLLEIVNDNMFGQCDLQLGKPYDVPTGGSFNTIIDRKLQTPPPTPPPPEERYRFKIGPSGSITRDFSFNMELSALAQAQALYSTQLAINAAQKDQKVETESAADKAYKNASFQNTPNADGYYSINAIEISLVTDMDKWNTKISSSLNVGEVAKESDAEVEKKNMNEVMDQNFVKFKLSKDSKDKSVNHLIYTDKSLIQSEIPVQQEGTTALTFLEISLGIDGMSGLSCGEYFLMDGVPEIYNQNGYFQITNVKQGLNDDGWKTTIEAAYRIEVKKKT